MILTDEDILELMSREEDPLIIEPLPGKPQEPGQWMFYTNLTMPQWLQPASVELTLADSFKTVEGEQLSLRPDGTFLMLPNEFVLASVQQYIHIPDDHAARVEGKSSFGRLGLQVHATAGFIDPGFRGMVTLELKNLTPYNMYLTPGEPICQLAVLQCTRKARRPYGSAGLGSHYQDQQGTTPSYKGQ